MAEPQRPPRENLIRATGDDGALDVDRSESSEMPVLTGYAAVFDRWTEVNSAYEGRFMERIAHGAFTKTITDRRYQIRVLLEHGRDPHVGKKPLGPLRVIEEDDHGLRYEVPLLDTSYNRDLIPGLDAGLYGASFRMAVMRDDVVSRPKKTAHNPEGLMERTVQEVRMPELGPVTFGAYRDATAGLRSMTDEFLLDALAEDPERFQALLGRSQIVVPEMAVHVDGFVSDDIGAVVRDALIPRSSVDRTDRSRREYRRSVEYVAETPWAMHPSALEVIHAIISERASGYRPDADEIARRIGTRAESDATAPDSVALLRLSGPIVPKAGMMDETSAPLQSVEGFQAELRAALADGNVSAIVIDIDSPGGSVDLIPELASEIMAGRDVKPIIGVANTMAASAAYWLGCACSELVVTPSGTVGSIGVYSSHTDLSAAMAQKGIKTTFISAGDYKVERNPFEPLSREAEAEMQDKVDAYYDMFVAGVAKGRGVSTKTVLSDFGQGRMLLAAKAVDVGMADSVATLDETLARLGASVSEPEPPEATTPEMDASAPEPPEATTRHPSRNPAAIFGTRKDADTWRL